MLGVVDDGDPASSNTVVSFLLSANPSADFDQDNDVDGFDLLALQRGLGTTIGASHADGDADRDGDVDIDDLLFWENAYGTTAMVGAQAVPEPSLPALLICAVGSFCLFRTSRP